MMRPENHDVKKNEKHEKSLTFTFDRTKFAPVHEERKRRKSINADAAGPTECARDVVDEIPKQGPVLYLNLIQ
jgi:hypothetical protein